MYFIEELNSSWSRFQAGSTWMGWVVSSEVQRRQFIRTLNTASVRPIYIITMLEFSRYQSCVCWNLTNALDTQRSPSVAYLSLPCPSISKLHVPPRCYCSFAKRHRWHSSFRNPPFIHHEQAPWGPWLGTSLYTSPKSPPKLLHCNKVVFLKGSKVALGVEGTPRICQSQEAVLYQVWGVYANVVHHVDVLDGLVLSLDEGGAARTCFDSTLFWGLRAGGERGQERLSPGTDPWDCGWVARMAPQRQRSSSCESFGIQPQATQSGRILPPSQVATRQASHQGGPRPTPRSAGHLHASAFLLFRRIFFFS